MNGIDALLGEMDKHQFAARHFHKLPYSAAHRAADYRALCDWQSIERILGEPEVDAMVCRRGKQYSGALPSCGGAARRLSDEGYTILVRHAERHDRRLQDLATSFQKDFGGQVNVHIYATPPEEFGFGWHYDAEDVFILQTAGSKEYALRKNSVHPWPLPETIPADMRYEREIMPLLRCLLQAGDWLYIPTGYWHMGRAVEASVSLAVGVMSPAALDIHDLARGRLAQSLLWRQRLETVGQACPLDSEQKRTYLRHTLQMMARDLSDLYNSEEFLDAVLEHFQ